MLSGGGLASAACLRSALVQYGIPEGLADEIEDEVASATFRTEHGASEHLQAQLTACLANTFVTFDGVAGGTRMARGTGAGTPLADILFLLAIMKVIKRLRAALEAEGLMVKLEVVGRKNLGLHSGHDASMEDRDAVTLNDVSLRTISHLP